MATWVIVLITVMYAVAAINLFTKCQWQLGMVYAGYAFANIGLIAMMFTSS